MGILGALGDALSGDVQALVLSGDVEPFVGGFAGGRGFAFLKTSGFSGQMPDLYEPFEPVPARFDPNGAHTVPGTGSIYMNDDQFAAYNLRKAQRRLLVFLVCGGFGALVSWKKQHDPDSRLGVFAQFLGNDYLADISYSDEESFQYTMREKEAAREKQEAKQEKVEHMKETKHEKIEHMKEKKEHWMEGKKGGYRGNDSVSEFRQNDSDEHGKGKGRKHEKVEQMKEKKHEKLEDFKDKKHEKREDFLEKKHEKREDFLDKKHEKREDFKEKKHEKREDLLEKKEWKMEKKMEMKEFRKGGK